MPACLCHRRFNAVLTYFLIVQASIFSMQPSGPDSLPPYVAVADSLIEEERDSVLFHLNLAYLNGINERNTPYDQIAIMERILELDPGNFSFNQNIPD